MTHLVINVKGGCVQLIIADEDVEVLVDDHDADEWGSTCLEIDPTYVSQFFGTYDATFREDRHD